MIILLGANWVDVILDLSEFENKLDNAFYIYSNAAQATTTAVDAGSPNAAATKKRGRRRKQVDTALAGSVATNRSIAGRTS